MPIDLHGFTAGIIDRNSPDRILILIDTVTLGIRSLVLRRVMAIPAVLKLIPSTAYIAVTDHV